MSQAKKNCLRIGDGENNYQIDSKVLQNFYSKIDLLATTGYKEIIQLRKVCQDNLNDELKKKMNYFYQKIH